MKELRTQKDALLRVKEKEKEEMRNEYELKIDDMD